MMPKYYKPSLPSSLKTEIENLFRKDKKIRNLYNNNAVKFIEEAIREKIFRITPTDLATKTDDLEKENERLKRELERIRDLISKELPNDFH